MKQKDSNKSITFGAMEGFDTVISADGSGFLVALLRDKLYTDKRKVALFETLANAVDANRWVNAKKNVEIILTRKNLVIRDYGPGCDRDKMQNVYFAYCNSTKSNDNENIGGFGIGSKSPSAYSDAYFVVSRNGGMATMYMSVIDGRTNKVSVMYSIPLEDPDDTGLTVIIPISEDRDVDSELEIFNTLILDGLVFRMASQGYDCIDYYDARSLDEDIEGWDALPEDKRKSYLFSVFSEDGTVPAKWHSVAAMREITEKCPYFAKLRGAAGCPDEHIKLHADDVESQVTYGELATAYEAIEAKLKAMKTAPGGRDVSVLTDSDIPDEIMRISRKYRLDYVPKVGFVFNYSVESPFYRGCSMGSYMVLACDGDMTYGIPGELPGLYSSKGFVEKDYPSGDSWNSKHTMLLAEFGRDELTIQPNRETVAADDALDSWLADRCSGVDRYYTMKCFVLSRCNNLGTTCLLYDCAKKAENYMNGEYAPLSNWLMRDIQASITSTVNSVSNAYSKGMDIAKHINKAFSYRTARYNENGKYALGELKQGSSRVTNFLACRNKTVVVLNDCADVDTDNDIRLIPEDFDHLKKGLASQNALKDFIDSSKSNADSDAESNEHLVLLVDDSKYAAFKKATNKFFRCKGSAGFLEGIDLFKFSEIQKLRQSGGYYDKCVNVKLKEVEELAYSYIESKMDAAVAAADGNSDDATVKAVASVDKPKVKARKKRAATGSSTLTKSKPLCTIKYAGVKSVNGDPVSVNEFNDMRTKEAAAYRKGAVDWSKFSDTVMVPTKRRFRGTDVLSTVLLRSNGDDSDSTCCGNMLRALLGIKYVVRVLPSEMESLAKDNGWDVWNNVDYIGRLQNVIDTFKLTNIPARLYGLLTSSGLSWDSAKCSRIKTVSMNNNGIGVSASVDLGGKYCNVPLTRLMTCILYVLRCVDSDPCYDDSRSGTKYQYSTMCAAVLNKFRDMETSCIDSLAAASDKDKKAVMACVNGHCSMVDPGISSVFGVSEKCTVSDAVLKKGYGVFLKSMSCFNKPMNLSDALGVKKVLTASVE